MSGFGEMRGWSDFERDLWNGGYGPAGAWWMHPDDEDDDRLSDGSQPTSPVSAAAPDPYRDAEHAVGCPANDLDPLDHSPCVCGLRDTINPWGRVHP